METRLFFLKKMLKKKINANKRFKNVGSVVKSGVTINDVNILSENFIAKRKSELFKRIKASTLQKILSVEC